MSSHYPRETEFWTPAPLWRGDPAFIIGGGPSLRDFDLRRLRDRRVIAVNSSARPVLAAGIADPLLYFTDTNWWEDNETLIRTWPGPVFSRSRVAKGAAPDLIARVDLEMRADFRPGDPKLKQGRTSGHTAISLAVALGADPIILLGFDMRVVDGRSHHHDDYATPNPSLFAQDFLPAFAGWQAAAERAGVRIWNATPGSALSEFPMVEIDDVLEVLCAAR